MITSGLEFQLRENYTIQQREYDGRFWASNFTFTKENGFAIAASFWYPEDKARWDDPEIGELKFYNKYWNNNELPKFRELRTRSCTDEDFQVAEGEKRSEYGFFLPSETTLETIANEMHALKCVDEPVEISGDFDTFSAQNLMVVFEICDPEVRKCKSQEEI